MRRGRPGLTPRVRKVREVTPNTGFAIRTGGLVALVERTLLHTRGDRSAISMRK